MSEFFWTSWQDVVRAVIVCAGGYLGLVVLLRGGGKRATSKLNMFDWAVTVALGSMLATTVLSASVPLAVGLAAFATLIGLQFVISWLSVRSETIRRFVKAEPRLLYHQGRFLRGNMRKERIAEEEIRAAVREAGRGSIEDVSAVVLETNAELSVIRGELPGGEAGTLEDVPTIGSS